MKVFVTGVAGQLGADVVNELYRRGHTALGSDLAEHYSGLAPEVPEHMTYIPLDITDEGKVCEIISRERPDAVIHCAAWTAVDAAELPENREKVFAVNVLGTQNLAKASKSVDAAMVYISTDYVFNGLGSDPWTPDCKSYRPLNVYGESKLQGELAVSGTLDKYFIVRTAWVFGRNGNNFIKTMLKLSKTHDTLRVVSDQIGTPTYTFDLARLLVDMIETTRYGYYHATNEGGYISWYDFACEIFRQSGATTKVIPVTSAEYGQSVATRPYNSRLDKSKLQAQGFEALPPWQDALSRYLKEIEV